MNVRSHEFCVRPACVLCVYACIYVHIYIYVCVSMHGWRMLRATVSVLCPWSDHYYGKQLYDESKAARRLVPNPANCTYLHSSNPSPISVVVPGRTNQSISNQVRVHRGTDGGLGRPRRNQKKHCPISSCAGEALHNRAP